MPDSKELRSHKRGKHIEKKVSLDTRDRQQRRCDHHQDPNIRQFGRSIHKDVIREAVLQIRGRNGSERNVSSPLGHSGRLLEMP